MKDVIVCVATTPHFQKGMERLRESCKRHWKAGAMFFTDWPTPAGIPSLPQSQMPYQFKVAAIQQAIEAGYERIIWLDSTMWLIKNPIELFNGKWGFFFENLGHPVWKYISKDAENKLDRYLVNEDIMQIKQVWGGAFGLDFSFNFTKVFFKELCELSLNGAFKDGTSDREGFVAHRHDQAVMSVMVHGNLELLPYGYIVSDEHLRSGEYGNNNYILYKGI